MNIAKLHPLTLTGLNILVIVGSASLCLLLLPTRLPGMEILGVGPSWLVMWTIAWSLRRSIWSAATAGIILGMIQDGMTFPASKLQGAVMPTHILSLIIVGVLASWLYKHRYIDDKIVTVVIITFLLAIVAESIVCGQYLFQMTIGQSVAVNFDIINSLLTDRFPVMLIAGILSGLWMPILYCPLHFWWQKMFGAIKFI
jgi:rod shape-determining protein MreD